MAVASWDRWVSELDEHALDEFELLESRSKPKPTTIRTRATGASANLTSNRVDHDPEALVASDSE